MLSRIADSLFWLNRYMERADGIVRIIKTNYILSLDKGINESTNWRLPLELFACVDKKALALAENSAEEALKILILNTDNTNSLKSIVTRARENARGVQDHDTKEVWEQVNQLYHLVHQSVFVRKLTNYNVLEAIDILTKNLVQYAGVTDTTMPRGMGWSFMNLGRHIERSLLTVEMTQRQFQVIDYDLKNQRDILQWRYLLLSLSGYELHLKNYRSTNYNYNVLHQVLFNPDFTRSVTYTLSRIDKYLNDVISESNYAGNVSLLRCYGRLYSMVRYTDFESLDDNNLKTLLANIKSEILNFTKSFEQNFFSYS